MILAVDENIPCALDAFREFGEVRLVPGRSLAREDLADVDILVVRSVTAVGRALLEGTPVRFVATATNGIDHVDLDYLNEAGIGFASAVGANASAVAEYVVAGLLELRERGHVRLQGETLGIVGVGNVGGRLATRARALGMHTVEYDPPRALRDPGFRSAALDELFLCDIISLHVPLLSDGEHATVRMVDKGFLERMRPGAVLINSSRGPIVDSAALIASLRSGHTGAGMLDVWEGEPSVPVELVEACAITTPHIAAYSYDAKLKGTAMTAEAVAMALGCGLRWNPASSLSSAGNAVVIPPGTSPLDGARRAVLAAYDIMIDDAAVRELLMLEEEARRAGFDLLRKTYRVRREFPAWEVVADAADVCSLLSRLGFRIAGGSV